MKGKFALAAVCLMVACQLAFAASVSAEAIRCNIHEKYQCQPSIGCNPIPAKIWNIVNLSEGRISRCDDKGCDTYQAAVTQSGIFFIIDVPGHGMLAKVSADGSMFSEVTTVTTTTLVSFGSCEQ